LDWGKLAFASHYHTAVAIREALREGNVDDATVGLEELIDALSRSDERALESHLTRLMQHLIKWKVQPERRSPSWVYTIREQRHQVRRLQQKYPRFSDRYITEQIWDDCYESGVNEAGRDMDRFISHPPELNWEDVFDIEYTLDDQEA
jgi:hypothetical protein